MLLAKGANVNAIKSHDGQTALHIAWARQHAEVAEMLLNVPGVNLNLPDAKARTPLHAAAAQPGKDGLAIVRILLKHGVSPGLLDKDGISPLHKAARHGDVELATMLLDAGVDPMLRAPESEGKPSTTPLHWACAFGHAGMVALLLSRCLDKVSPTFQEGESVSRFSSVGSTCLFSHFLHMPFSSLRMLQ
jgi:ankyrin